MNKKKLASCLETLRRRIVPDSLLVTLQLPAVLALTGQAAAWAQLKM